MKKLLVLLVVMALTGIASAEMLTDNDFEMGVGSDWIVWSAGIFDDGSATNNAVKMWTGGTQWSGGGATQEVQGGGLDHIQVTPGYQYSMIADFMVDSAEPFAAGVNAFIRFEYFDAGHNILNGTYGEDVGHLNLASGLTEDVWHVGAMTGFTIAPAGAVEMHPILKLEDTTGQPIGTPNTAVWYDNASAIETVPEPMTMGLLGLGGLFLRRRK